MENNNFCTTCIHATVLVTNEILCSKYGVLNSDTSCKHFVEDLTKKELRKKRTVKIQNLSD